MRSCRSTLAIVVCLAISSPLLGAVRMPKIFSDNMVLQRDVPVPVWGWAKPGEKVTVKFAGQEQQATADDDGVWSVKLARLPANSAPMKLTVSGTNTITFTNVLVGDVWLCAGQSNMETYMYGVKDGPEAVAAAKFPLLRLFTVGLSIAGEPQTDCKVRHSWVECSPETAQVFSAVAFYFGRELQQTLKVPIGLVVSAVGASPIITFNSRAVFEERQEFKAILAQWETDFEKGRTTLEQTLKEYETWLVDARKALRENKVYSMPGPPQLPYIYYTHQRPTALYNGMIAPLIPYALRGVIWYQGEDDNVAIYEAMFQAMIRDWRKRWGQGDFPFLFVQLPGFRAPQTEPVQVGQPCWGMYREAQTRALELPNTGMAVTLDTIDDAFNIHPLNKAPVGHRLALAATKIAYGMDVVYSGPVYEKMEVKGDTIRLQFSHIGSSLVFKGDGTPKGFAIAGADRKFVWADAKIEGNQVVLSSSNVRTPVAARYAWANNPLFSLYNKEGLPASPFRTDNWK